MTDLQWKRVFEIYEAAVTLPRESIEAFIDSSDEDQAVLRKVTTIIESLPHEEIAKAAYTGCKVGRYEVVRLVGQGSTGDVYSGLDCELNRPVALKFMSSGFAEAIAGTQSFVREAQAASALNHPNIVTIYEVIMHDSLPVIVMELVEGAALRNICGKHLPLSQALQIGSQLLQALAFAHSRNFVHRDLKPENVIVRSDGYVKVLDFGLAKQILPVAALQHSLNLGLPVGTLRYMSPEQCRGEQATPASDVFSAGIVLYEMLTGKHPFDDESPFGTAHAILEKHPEPPIRYAPSVPPAVNGLLMRMLAKPAQDRPSAQEAAAVLLAGNANSQTTSRFRRLIALAAVLMAGATLSFWAVRLREPEKLYPAKQLTYLDPGNRVTAAAVSPDGLSIAFADADGSLHLRNTAGTAEKITGHFHHNRVDKIWWVPGKSRLLLSSREENSESLSYPIWLLDLDSATPRRLPVQGLDAAPSPDGAKIAYLSPNRADLWVADAEGNQPRKIVATNGELSWFAWSPHNSLLHYGAQSGPAARQSQSGILFTVDSASGRLVSEQHSELTPWPFFLPDDRILFYQEALPIEGGLRTLLESQFDPARGVLVGKPRRLAGFDRVELVPGQLSASNDGRAIAAVMEDAPGRRAPARHIFVADLTPPSLRLKNIRRLTLNGAQAFAHSWTADSRSVILESDQLREQHIFVQPMDSKTADPLCILPGIQAMAMLSPDGGWILFLNSTKVPHKWLLMRVPVGGGTPQEVPTGGPIQDFSCKYKAKRCVIREVANNQSVFYELDPVKGKGRELARIAAGGVFGDYDLSPDGSMVSTTNIGQVPATIRVTYLDRAPLQKEIRVEGPPPGGLAVWAPDGRGWYMATADQQTRFIDWAGHSRFVYDTGNWMVPSWDGKHVALLDSNHSTNVWLVRR